ncbi:MAG: MFS transporter, partial [Verrucomicrobia bacterium]
RVKSSPSKSGYYLLEGANAFATAYFFNYLLQRLHGTHGLSDLEILVVCMIHGFLYIPMSWLGGRFGQRHGYFASLRIGFAGMFLGVVLPWAVPTVWAHGVGLAVWTGSMCFTWPILEALVSEHESVERLPHRVGLYNLVWASCSAAAVFLGGTIYQRLGGASLYWFPAAVHAVQLAATFLLQRRHDAWAASVPPEFHHPAGRPPDASRPAYFVRLGWIGNPFNYMAVNTVLAFVPALGNRLGYDVAQIGRIMSLWQAVRAVSFVVLWFWHGWHYRFGWFVASLALLLGGFVAVVVAPNLWVLLVAQILFGWATAVLYYSALFYSMDGSTTKGEHGGIHEAFIGCGIFGGPAVGTLAVWATGNPLSPAWAVGAFILGGLGLAGWIRRRGLAAPDA